MAASPILFFGMAIYVDHVFNFGLFLPSGPNITMKCKCLTKIRFGIGDQINEMIFKAEVWPSRSDSHVTLEEVSTCSVFFKFSCHFLMNKVEISSLFMTASNIGRTKARIVARNTTVVPPNLRLIGYKKKT